MSCIECKTVIPADSRFCLHCGATQPTHESLEVPAWKTSAERSRPEAKAICPECGGERVKADSDFLLYRKSDKKSEDTQFSTLKPLTLRPIVCLECGLTAFYTSYTRKTQELNNEILNFKNAPTAKQELLGIAQKFFGDELKGVLTAINNTAPNEESLVYLCNSIWKTILPVVGKKKADDFYKQAIAILDNYYK